MKKRSIWLIKYNLCLYVMLIFLIILTSNCTRKTAISDTQLPESSESGVIFQETVESKLEIPESEVLVVEEVELFTITLPDFLADKNAEISGMTWYKDWLILLPQYPERFQDQGISNLFFIDKTDILNYLHEKDSDVIIVQTLELDDASIRSAIKGYEGYEAIAFYNDRVYLSIEANEGNQMKGYLIYGKIDEQSLRITLVSDSLVELQVQNSFENASYEAITIFNDEIYAIFEDNGVSQNANPRVLKFDLDLKLIAEIPITSINFRITDATTVDDKGNFWIMNYFFPGDTFLESHEDPIADQYGEGLTHQLYDPVERIVQMTITEHYVKFADIPPIQFKLLEGNEARNWEGLVKLDNLGFLVVTDKFPGTILGFCEILR